jgi:hypothetical protein
MVRDCAGGFSQFLMANQLGDDLLDRGFRELLSKVCV